MSREVKGETEYKFNSCRTVQIGKGLNISPPQVSEFRTARSR